MPKNKITETQNIISFHLVSEETGAGFPGGSEDKNPPANREDKGLISPVQENLTCHGATKPVCHNY